MRGCAQFSFPLSRISAYLLSSYYSFTTPFSASQELLAFFTMTTSPPTEKDSSSDIIQEKGGLHGGIGVQHVLTAGQDSFNKHEQTNEDMKRTKRIMRKLDLRVLPVASVLYLFSFLDRSAIGNAKVAGMATQLDLTDSKYRASVSVFFALYCLLEGQCDLNEERI